MKKIICAILALMTLTVALSGCAKSESSDVKALREQLTEYAGVSAEKYFDLKMDTGDFDIEIGRKTGNTTFETLSTTDTTEDIYLTGHFNGKPKTITDFIVVYDPNTKEVAQFGIKNISDDEMQYADLSK